MNEYERIAQYEMSQWQRAMMRKPSWAGRYARKTQKKINSMIPEKVHKVITAAFKNMVNGVLTGAKFISGKPYQQATLEMREIRVKDKINVYKNTSAAEGAITGAGGILLGLADFPAWLTLKIKMMFDIAQLYGYDTSDYKERLYILHVFQLAFSGAEHRRDVFVTIADWEHYSKNLPPKDEFDWRSFQQEYRDYLDLAKFLQLIPGVGAVVGAYVNHKLTNKLGTTAINAYRMRYFAEKG